MMMRDRMEIDPTRLEQVDAVVREGLNSGLYSAAVYALARAEEVTALKAFGWLGEAGRRPAAPGSIFDLASLTNPDGNSRSFGYSSHQLTSQQWSPASETYSYADNGDIASLDRGPFTGGAVTRYKQVVDDGISSGAGPVTFIRPVRD